MSTLFARRSAGRPSLPSGTRRVEADGTIRIKVGNRWRTETQLVAEELLGRGLRAGERPVHLDGNASNNEAANIEVWARVRVWPPVVGPAPTSEGSEGSSAPGEITSVDGLVAYAAAHTQTVAKRRARQAAARQRRREASA